MEDLRTRFDGLEDKLRSLIKKLEEYRTENVLLKSQVADFQNVIDRQKKQIKGIEESNKMVKIADTVSGELKVDQDLKKRIDKYVKEIDKCIALLRE